MFLGFLMVLNISLASFNNFVDEKYILSDNAFVRSGKWSLIPLFFIVRKQNLMKLIGI